MCAIILWSFDITNYGVVSYNKSNTISQTHTVSQANTVGQLSREITET